MNVKTHWILMLLLAVAAPARSQDAGADGEATFESAAATARVQLQESIDEYNALQERITQEKLPLTRKLNDLESELIKVRKEFQAAQRKLDTSTLDMSNLGKEIEARKNETVYLSNLLSEYIRNFETRLHIAELGRYEDALEAAKLAPESDAPPQEVFQTQITLVAKSLERLHDAVGGTIFPGSAVNADGEVKEGTFVLIGPSALFRSQDGNVLGTAEQTLGSLLPTLMPFKNPSDADAVATLFRSNGQDGAFPLDPTLGNAHVIESTEETIIEHARKGGPVMIPIVGLAGAALLVALYKWISLLFVRKPSQRKIRALLKAIAAGDHDGAMKSAKSVGGPTGKMLVIGMEHVDEPRELVEEMMFEKVLDTKLRVQRFLPFVAIAAASAPLLGLLGTVTGIINTFKLITVFGTGDVKTLSGGISEALITTEFGLIVAIPSLLLHAFLSRKARGVVDQMEKSAVAFVNQLGKTPLVSPAKREAEAARLSAADSEALTAPTVIKAAIANLESKLNGDGNFNGNEREAISSALQRLNHSAVELVKAVYEVTSARVPASADAKAASDSNAATAVEEKPSDETETDDSKTTPDESQSSS